MDASDVITAFVSVGGARWYRVQLRIRREAGCPLGARSSKPFCESAASLGIRDALEPRHPDRGALVCDLLFELSASGRAACVL